MHSSRFERIEEIKSHLPKELRTRYINVFVSNVHIRKPGMCCVSVATHAICLYAEREIARQPNETCFKIWIIRKNGIAAGRSHAVSKRGRIMGRWTHRQQFRRSRVRNL